MKHLLCLICLVSLSIADAFQEGVDAYKNNQFLQAKALFERAIQEEQSIHANYYLGKMYLRGEGMDVHLPSAISYLEQAVIKGNVKAQCYLAEAYLKSKIKRDSALLLLQEGIKENYTCKEVAALFKIPIATLKPQKEESK